LVVGERLVLAAAAMAEVVAVQVRYSTHTLLREAGVGAMLIEAILATVVDLVEAVAVAVELAHQLMEQVLQGKAIEVDLDI
jgi:hypothetical protein